MKKKYFYIERATDDQSYIHFKRKRKGNYFETQKGAKEVFDLLITFLNLMKCLK